METDESLGSEGERPFEEPVTEYDRIMARFKASVRRLPRYGRLAANMLRDDRVPLEARSALVAGGAYVISPIDLIPGFIPVLGQLDDLLVALLGLRFALAQSPVEVREEHLERAGLRDEDFAEDLRTVRDTSIYLVKSGARRTARGVGRAVRSAGGRLRRRIDHGEASV
ncbi:MAG: YkvA family protein [Thermomicrobiales bacterium]